MNKFICILIILLFLCSCSHKNQISENTTQVTETDNNTIKAVWIYYSELDMSNSKPVTEEKFVKKINSIFKDCRNFGLNTVFVQIRPFADSFYPSEIFPWSKFISGEQGKGVDFDPLEIMITSAHRLNLSFHAWINPFRISFNNKIDTLSQNHPALKFSNPDGIISCEKGLYFNPSNIEVQKYIIEGAKEIALNYAVDGIHIDDYFYPTTEKSIDELQYNDYLKKGGMLTLAQWRTENINSFVSGLYSSVKSVNPDICFSISPSGNIDNNYSVLFADVERWSNTNGYCDMIIPQLYYGFKNKALPYEKALNQWAELNQNETIKLIGGIGVYKTVNAVTEEWKNTDIIYNQVRAIFSHSKFDGYALFSYSSLIAVKNKDQLPTNTVS